MFGGCAFRGSVAVSAPTKVLRVVRGFVPTQLDPEDLHGLDPKEQAVLNQARERLRSCIRRYLGDPDAAAPMPKKIFRVATHRYLQAIDSALTVVTGCGLERFSTTGTDLEVIKEDQRVSVSDWVARPLMGLDSGRRPTEFVARRVRVACSMAI